MRRVDLVENGQSVDIHLTDEVGVTIAATGFIDARPIPGTRMWSLRPLSKVGVVAVAGFELHVVPKIPIQRVIFLLENSLAGVTWRTEEVEVEESSDLLRAVVEAFERLASKALRPGLLQGYRTVEESLPVVRGRIREADQLRLRYGLAVPLEVRYDDFTPDIAENRLLRAAVILSRRLPGLDTDLRHRLLRLDAQLAEVAAIDLRRGLESWHPTRLNARLHHALHLAGVIVRHCSFEPRGDGTIVIGFIVNMAKVFEDFLCTQLANRFSTIGGRVRTQDRWHLDVDRRIAMAPDLVWYSAGARPSVVVDAKYKAEKPSGYPDADLYQMLAYCTALGLSDGHLVYAKGNEVGALHDVVGTDVSIHVHTLDLSQGPAELMIQMDELARAINRPGRPVSQLRTAPGAEPRLPSA